jgi:hypothetical protein
LFVYSLIFVSVTQQHFWRRPVSTGYQSNTWLLYCASTKCSNVDVHAI